MESIESKAKIIAQIINDTDIDYRGDLLYCIGELLRREAQGFTGAIFLSAGHQYGLSDRHENH